MGVKVIERIYNEIYNTDSKDWLIGNAGDIQVLKIRFGSSVSFIGSQTDTVEIKENTLSLTNGAKWQSYGFDLGDSVVINVKKSTGVGSTFIQLAFRIQIVQVYGDTIEFEFTDSVFAELWESTLLSVFSVLPSNQGTDRAYDLVMYTDKDPEGVSITYGNILNSEADTETLNSVVDGSETTFSGNGLNLLSNSETIRLQPVGVQSGMSVRSMRVKKIGTALDVFEVPIRTFEAEIEFVINGFLIDPEDFDEITESPESFLGTESLTDNFLIKVFPEWNNPNTVIENDLSNTVRLGNTGWFNENFNELPNEFKVERISYLNKEGATVHALSYVDETVVEIEVSGIKVIDSNTETGFGFFWVPESKGDYSGMKTPQYQNIYMSNGSYSEGFRINTSYVNENVGAGVNGASINTKDISVRREGNNLILRVVFVPNELFVSVFEQKDPSDRRYVMYISVSDFNTQRNFSNRVSLLADFSSLEKNVPSAGAYDLITNEFLEHPFSENARGVGVYKGIVQDDVLARMPFQVRKSDVLNSMTFGVEIRSDSGVSKMDLDYLQVDLTQYATDSKGVQQFNFDSTRGYNLESGNNKNWVKILRQDSLDTTGLNGYIAYFAFHIRWEDWLAKQNAIEEFFDISLPLNGLSNDWVGYLRKEGYNINFFTKINANVGGEVLEYNNQFPFEFSDYDENILIATKHEYRSESGDVINVGIDADTGKPLGVVLRNQRTTIEISYEILDGSTWNLSSVYSSLTMEIDKGAGVSDKRQISSVWGSESDNPLKPVEGETRLKMELNGDSTILTTTCEVEPSLLGDAQRYRVTGRVGCFENNDNFNTGLYEFRYESKYE